MKSRGKEAVATGPYNRNGDDCNIVVRVTCEVRYEKRSIRLSL